MRNVLTVTCLLAFTQFAMAQSASSDANMDLLTVRISEDGVCHFLDDSAPCEQLGKYLLSTVRNLSSGIVCLGSLSDLSHA